jgi:hypothetical protein
VSAKVLFVLLAGWVLVATPVLAQETFTFSGDIASGAQFDLYVVNIEGGKHIVATLVCDFDGVSRPLDPVLSVYFDSSDPSDTANADYYNDDGFGSDDYPDGVDCDAFDSSRIAFNTSGDADNYTFRVDGFGSSTGPYTLTITITDRDYPEGEVSFFEPGDDRINRQAYAQAAVYCDAANSRVLILGIDAGGDGSELLSVPYGDLPAKPTGQHVQIEQAGNVGFYRLATGEYQVNVGPDSEGKTYVAIWDGCPYTYLNAYILQNGVMTQTESNTP